MNRTASRLVDRAERDGRKVLRYPARDVAKLRDLYDLVACAREPDALQSEELAGLVLDDGMVIAPGPGSLGRFFHDVRDAGDVVVATRPKNPEVSRVNAATRSNPAVGRMDRDDAIRMMRSDLRDGTPLPSGLRGGRIPDK